MNAFFEDEKGIAYVGSETEFDLEQSSIGSPRHLVYIIKERRKKCRSFQVKVQKNKDEYISISDVQVKERTMKADRYLNIEQSGKYSTAQ